MLIRWDHGDLLLRFCRRVQLVAQPFRRQTAQPPSRSPAGPWSESDSYWKGSNAPRSKSRAQLWREYRWLWLAAIAIALADRLQVDQ